MTDASILSALVDELPMAVWVARVPGGEFVYANRRFVDIMGMEALKDVTAGHYSVPYEIHTQDGHVYPEEKLPFARAIKERATVTVDDMVIHRRDGRHVHVRAHARPVFDGEQITYVVVAFADISREVEAERARVESDARLHRAQKMESIGKLAGGIA